MLNVAISNVNPGTWVIRCVALLCCCETMILKRVRQ